MSWILDTSIAIHLRDRDPDIMTRVAELEGAVLLSVVSHVELEGGVYRIPEEASVRRARLDVLLGALPVVDFDAAAAAAYRRIIETARHIEIVRFMRSYSFRHV